MHACSARKTTLVIMLLKLNVPLVYILLSPHERQVTKTILSIRLAFKLCQISENLFLATHKKTDCMIESDKSMKYFLNIIVKGIIGDQLSETLVWCANNV